MQRWLSTTKVHYKIMTVRQVIDDIKPITSFTCSSSCISKLDGGTETPRHEFISS
jgi:hypothetical protein